MTLRVSNVSFSETSKFNEFKTGITTPEKQTKDIVTQPQTNIEAPTAPMPPSNKQGLKNFAQYNQGLISSGLAFISLGVATVAVVKSGKGNKLFASAESKLGELAGKIDGVGTQIGRMVDDAAEISQKVTNIADKNQSLETTVNSMSQKVEDAVSASVKASETTKEGGWFDNWLKELTGRVSGLETNIGHRASAMIDRTMLDIDGIPLLRNLNNDGKPLELSKKTQEYLQKVAGRYINKWDDVHLNKLDKDSHVWSLTSESIPEKEGGLGEVPVQIAKNLTETFKINNFIVRPLSLIKGKSQLVNEGGQTIYRYNINDPKPWEMKVTKIAKFDTQVCRNGKYETEPVEVYIGKDPKFGFERIMFANDNYFTANGLYTDTIKVSEPERYAFFNKVAYDFAKLVTDPNSMTNYSVTNIEAFKKIKPPKALLLNDWHAGGIAPLMRLKSVCEAEMGELSAKAAEQFKSINILNINHNLKHQGINYQHRSDILNTLFDKYAYDIYRFSKTGFGEPGLDKVLMTGDSVNLANMAASLSNLLKPVSRTYSMELASHPSASYYMQKICEVRLKQKTMQGASNGWDRVLNEVSQQNIKGYNDAINSDKIAIFKDTLLNIPGLNAEQLAKIRKIFNADNGIDSMNLKVKIEQLKAMESPAVTQALETMEAKGITVLREYKPYTYTDKTEVIMMNRRHNKQLFIDFLNNMIETNKHTSGAKKLFNIAESELTDLSHIKPEDLDDTIVFNMGVRFVNQKGVDIACSTIKRVLSEWESKYPGRKKPIFVIGGADGENGKIKKVAYALKRELGAENGKYVVYQDGYTKNNLFQSGSDFTLYPSRFEPDGAKWESLYRGTPVLCTRVGGHVDSIEGTLRGFLTKTSVPEIEMRTGGENTAKYVEEVSNEFTDIVYKAVDTFYDRPAYTKMVEESIRGDQSWLIKDANGNVTGGALLGHMRDLGFDLHDFPQILPEAVEAYYKAAA